MARKYSRSASKDVKSAMHRRKRGTLRSGRGGRGGKVKSRKQAIAIGLSEARRNGKEVGTALRALAHPTAHPPEPSPTAAARRRRAGGSGPWCAGAAPCRDE